MATIPAEQFLKGKKLTLVQSANKPPEPTKKGNPLADFSTGFAKGLLGSAIGTAKTFQGAGQRVLAGVDPTRNLEQVRAETGFKSLGGEQAKQIDEQLKSENTTEKVGKVVAFGAEILTPSGPRKAVTKGAELVAEGAKPVIRAGGRVLKETGEKAYGITVTPEKPTKIAMQTYKAEQGGFFKRLKDVITGTQPEGKPIAPAETAARHGIFGTENELGIQAKRITGELWTGKIQPKLQQVKGKVNMKSFITEVEKEINKSGGDITRRRTLQNALNAIKDDYKNVGKVNLEKLQDYKESWAEFIPDATYAGKPIAAGLKEVHNLMAKKAREVIYKHIGEEGKRAYIDYGNLRSIAEAGVKNTGKDPVSRGFFGNAWEVIMNQAITPVATISGKILYRTGEGLEFVGKRGAKKVKDIIKQ